MRPQTRSPTRGNSSLSPPVPPDVTGLLAADSGDKAGVAVRANLLMSDLGVLDWAAIFSVVAPALLPAAFSGKLLFVVVLLASLVTAVAGVDFFLAGGGR